MGRHCAGARIGEQVNQDVRGGQQEKVIVRGPEKVFTLLARRPADRLDTLDAKGFDDGTGHSKLLNHEGHEVTRRKFEQRAIDVGQHSLQYVH